MPGSFLIEYSLACLSFSFRFFDKIPSLFVWLALGCFIISLDWCCSMKRKLIPRFPSYDHFCTHWSWWHWFVLNLWNHYLVIWSKHLLFEHFRDTFWMMKLMEIVLNFRSIGFTTGDFIRILWMEVVIWQDLSTTGQLTLSTEAFGCQALIVSILQQGSRGMLEVLMVLLATWTLMRPTC